MTNNNMKSAYFSLLIRLLLLIVPLSVYISIINVFLIDFYQTQFQSLIEKTLHFIRYILLASGTIPFIISLAWILLAPFNEKGVVGGVFLILFGIVLHFIVSVFNAHTHLAYFIFQFIEILFLLFSFRVLNALKI